MHITRHRLAAVRTAFAALVLLAATLISPVSEATASGATCFGRAPTIESNAAVIYGTSGSDVIIGGPASQVIYAGGGRDFVCAGGGDDTIYGQTGRDNLAGEGGDDTLEGGNHDDEMWGGNGDDTLIGGPGNDYLNGGWHDDYIEGNDGDDYFFGTQDADVMYGGDGDDDLVVSEPDSAGDALDGGPGTNEIVGTVFHGTGPGSCNEITDEYGETQTVCEGNGTQTNLYW